MPLSKLSINYFSLDAEGEEKWALAAVLRRLSVRFARPRLSWRKEYGGLKTDQARRMKDLEKENLRLRRAISDLTLDKLILQEAARGNF